MVNIFNRALTCY